MITPYAVSFSSKYVTHEVIVREPRSLVDRSLRSAGKWLATAAMGAVMRRLAPGARRSFGKDIEAHESRELGSDRSRLDSALAALSLDGGFFILSKGDDHDRGDDLTHVLKGNRTPFGCVRQN